jgi:hypothetical protein
MLEGNLLYYGDNLDVLRRHVPTESANLDCLDPAFEPDPAPEVRSGCFRRLRASDGQQTAQLKRGRRAFQVRPKGEIDRMSPHRLGTSDCEEYFRQEVPPTYGMALGGVRHPPLTSSLFCRCRIQVQSALAQLLCARRLLTS